MTMKPQEEEAGGTLADIRSFFRNCPNCRRRFEIRIVRKELLHSANLLEKQELVLPAGSNAVPGLTVLQESVPTVVEVDDFEYRYRCGHCGHEWSEVHEEAHQLGERKD